MKRPRLLAGEDVPARPHQRRSLQARSRLMDAALALFAERGYDATSIQQLARRANLAVGGFYLHFRSKRQLVLALMDDLVARLAAIDLAPRPADSSLIIVRNLLQRAFATDFRYLGAYRAWREAALSDPTLSPHDQALHAWSTARVRRVFRQLLRLRGARRDVDVRTLAKVMDALFWSLMLQAPHWSPADRRAAVQATTHLVHHALFTDASPPRAG